ncbi:hypothetical protein MAR_012540 [Mya arenaria]|uniref:Ataxin-10 n=1 Tax=Mya arenaria TaxID=6604 RepID=A0ABY7G186_MYAAR|nr:hypothetical protein MAR_012540 [Mya arenaria]
MAALTDFQEIKLLLSEEGSIKLENAGAIFKTIDDFISTTLKSLSDRKFTCDSSLVEVLELIFTSFIAREPLNEGVLCLTNCFRLCRNLLAIDPSCQAEFLTSTLLQQTCSVLYKVLNKQQRSENEIVLLRCSVQFLGNFCSGNKANTYEVWKHCRQLFSILGRLSDGSPGGGGGGADPPAHQPPHISNLLFLAADFVHQHSLIPELASTHSAEDKWAVFAAHNLTEGNEENRAYIRALRLEGMANNQALLDEMGLSAEMKGDRVVVKKAKTN